MFTKWINDKFCSVSPECIEKILTFSFEKISANDINNIKILGLGTPQEACYQFYQMLFTAAHNPDSNLIALYNKKNFYPDNHVHDKTFLSKNIAKMIFYFLWFKVGRNMNENNHALECLVKVISSLTKWGYDINLHTTQLVCHGGTPLHWSVANCEKNAGYLLQAGNSPYVNDVAGKNSLMLLVLKGHHDGIATEHTRQSQYPLFKKMLEHSETSQHINDATIGGVTVLHMACLRGRPEFIKKLVVLGADPYKQDDEGKTPIDCLLLPPEERGQRLSYLLMRGVPDVPQVYDIKKLLDVATWGNSNINPSCTIDNIKEWRSQWLQKRIYHNNDTPEPANAEITHASEDTKDTKICADALHSPAKAMDDKQSDMQQADVNIEHSIYHNNDTPEPANAEITHASEDTKKAINKNLEGLALIVHVIMDSIECFILMIAAKLASIAKMMLELCAPCTRRMTDISSISDKSNHLSK